MKILMLGWELPPYNSGGLGVACYQLCKALSSKGADIEFVLPYTAEHNIDFMRIHAAYPQDVQEVLKSGMAYDSFKFIREDGSEEWVSFYDQHKIYEKGIDRIVELGEFDVIHAHDWLTFRAAMRAKQLSGKPLIVHVHATEYDRAGGKSGNPVVSEIEYMGMMMADKIIAVSQLTKDVIVREYGIPAEKIEVVHNSIDLSGYGNVEDQNSYHYIKRMHNEGYRVVMYFGRLTIQKNLHNLLLAAKEVVSRAPKTFFVIMGSGEQYYELIELSAGLGISKNVIFIDFQRGKKWRDIFEVCDLTVMPSVSEPFGLTPLESIGLGVPAMVSKQSGVAEVIRNCLKVDFWDIDAMANQITSVVQNDSLRDTLQMMSRDEVNKLSWHNTADQLMGLYSEQKIGVTV
jgi:glycogen synthase